MDSKNGPSPVLYELFRRRRVVDLSDLMGALRTRSRMTVFRRLREVSYLSSFTHTGRYYTLAGVPDFDEHGLWFHQGIGFSRSGTLKETVAVLVEAAEAGRTHSELESLVRVRVHNALLGLVEEARLTREVVGRLYLYASAEAGRFAEQVARRRALLAEATSPAPPLPAEVVIAVLVEALHASEGLAPSSVVAARLSAHGHHVTEVQVERVYTEYDLVPGKKTAEPPSIPSPS